jgi:antitoxin component of MazEF toxin-antitoxin module
MLTVQREAQGVKSMYPPQHIVRFRTGWIHAFDTPDACVYTFVYMIAVTKISSWGNSFGVRLPRSVLVAADIHNESELDVRTQDGSIILTPRKSKKKDLKQLLKNVRPASDPDTQAWVTMKPAGKEVW